MGRKKKCIKIKKSSEDEIKNEANFVQSPDVGDLLGYVKGDKVKFQDVLGNKGTGTITRFYPNEKEPCACILDDKYLFFRTSYIKNLKKVST